MKPYEDADVQVFRQTIAEGLASGDCEVCNFVRGAVFTHLAAIEFLFAQRAEALVYGVERMIESDERLRADVGWLWANRESTLQIWAEVGAYWHLSGDYMVLYRLQPKHKRVQVIRILSRSELYPPATWAGRVEAKGIVTT